LKSWQTRRAHGKGALVGVIASAIVLLFVQRYTRVHFFLYAAVGVLTCLVVGYLASVLIPSARQSLEGLTIHTAGSRKDTDELAIDRPAVEPTVSSHDVFDRKLWRLRVHRRHPFANGVFSFNVFFTDHCPFHVFRTEHQESFNAAFGKSRVNLCYDFFIFFRHMNLSYVQVGALTKRFLYRRTRFNQ
jgi:hypothetical protein